jgi:hypothetical protein
MILELLRLGIIIRPSSEWMNIRVWCSAFDLRKTLNEFEFLELPELPELIELPGLIELPEL